MESKLDRKAAIREYKERKQPIGIFAIRCTATGQVWAGSSRDLAAMRNRYWFGLRIGSSIDKSLQAEWNAHGEDQFAYEILEKLADDVSEFEIGDLLKAKRLEWIQKLGAHPLY